MATVLLTDEEYNHIKGLKQDLLGRVQNASPRAATHYALIARLHAEFIAREDGKRAQSKEKSETREELLKIKKARRNKAMQNESQPSGKAQKTA